MILTLDVGNTQLYGGVFQDDDLKFQFRFKLGGGSSSDELGVFLRGVLRENGVDPQSITKIALCSVVPDVVHSLRGACLKYFNREPFMLQAGVKTGLQIKYRNPLEVGADRIANAIAAVQNFPGKDIVIVDLGTATTFCVVNKEKHYLGGVIAPGMRLSMEALEANTAKLPAVEIKAPESIVGRSTVESIQSGLYFGHLSLLKHLTTDIKEQVLKNPQAIVIGTGGFSRLFEKENVFDITIPELVLFGLKQALKINI